MTEQVRPTGGLVASVTADGPGLEVRVYRSNKGRNIPYFRREMIFLDKLLKKQGIRGDRILSEFSKEQIEGIYPALSQAMMEALLEELELMGYLEIKV